MTPEQLFGIVARHRPYKPDAGFGVELESCEWCRRGWPCDTVQVLALLREAREALGAGYVELLNAPYSPIVDLDVQLPARLTALDGLLGAFRALLALGEP